MFCTKCGRLIEENTPFCVGCGYPVPAGAGAAAAANSGGNSAAYGGASSPMPQQTWQADATAATAVTPATAAVTATAPAPAAAAVTATAPTAAAASATNAAAVQQAAAPAPGQPLVVQNSPGKDGIGKCPRCGASEIELNIATGLLHCNYCHSEWSEAADALDFDIGTLQGVVVGAGAGDIPFSAEQVVTLKCSACGAEVVIDTSEAPQARCHWCRNTLSLNNQVPNGAVPDAILPFRLSKEQAKQRIEGFVRKRRFFAHPRFKAEFSTENIMGAYLPYMVIDANCHANLSGQGEHQTRKYTIDKKTYYDADLYDVGRDFDLHVDDLTVEASSDKINQKGSVNSNNVINSILPFPLKETLKFNANYLKGFTSEKRDLNRDAIAGVVNAQLRDVSRWQASRTTTFYDRGVRWDSMQLDVKGQLWKSVYLPVWLYSYMQDKGGGKKFLHYVAVNGVTGETMGSVPIHTPKLTMVSLIVELIGCAIGIPLAIWMLVFR